MITRAALLTLATVCAAAFVVAWCMMTQVATLSKIGLREGGAVAESESDDGP